MLSHAKAFRLISTFVSSAAIHVIPLFYYSICPTLDDCRDLLLSPFGILLLLSILDLPTTPTDKMT